MANLPLYLPLNQQHKEIRLATFQSLDESGCPSVSLSVASLAEGCPSYRALSYTWGKPNVTTQIRLNGRDWSVTTNLDAALRAMRRRLRRRNDDPRRFSIWIDAICINQGDTKEKDYQVPMMGDIYASAQEVLIWTGEADEDSCAAVELVLRWASLLGQLDQTRETQKVFLGSLSDAKQAAELAHSDLSSELRTQDLINTENDRMGLFTAQAIVQAVEKTGRRIEYVGYEATHHFRKFLERPYWSRIWTLQEQVLGQQSIVLCGQGEMNLLALYLTYYSLQTVSRWCPTSLSPEEKGPINALLANSVQASIEIRAGQVRSQNPFDPRVRLLYSSFGCLFLNVPSSNRSVWDMVLMTMAYTCSNPKDKIYGMLGMLEGEAQKIVHVDYASSDCDVYRRFVVACMRRMRSLDFIIFGGIQPADNLDETTQPKPVLPSWVPNFASANTLGVDTASFNASRDVPAHLADDLSDEITILRAQVIWVGQVTSASGPPAMDADPGDIMLQWAQMAASLPRRPRHCRSQSSSLTSRMNLFLDSMKSSSSYIGSNLPRELKQRWLQQVWRSVLASAARMGNPEMSTQLIKALNSPLEEDPGASRSNTLSHRVREIAALGEVAAMTWAPPDPQSEYTVNGFVYFLRNNYRQLIALNTPFLGFGGPDVRTGDFVGVLLGCRLPMVLRRSGSVHKDAYQIVGYATMPGVDNGELLGNGVHGAVDIDLV